LIFEWRNTTDHVKSHLINLAESSSEVLEDGLLEIFSQFDQSSLLYSPNSIFDNLMTRLQDNSDFDYFHKSDKRNMINEFLNPNLFIDQLFTNIIDLQIILPFEKDSVISKYKKSLEYVVK